MKKVGKNIGLVLITLLFSQSGFSQSLKKTFNYLQKDEIHKANIEIKKISSKTIKSEEEMTLYMLAGALLMSSDKINNSSAYDALEIYNRIHNSRADFEEVNRILTKYKYSIRGILRLIQRKILSTAKEIDSEAEYKKAAKYCGECPHKNEISELMELAAYSECIDKATIESYKYFVANYNHSILANSVEQLIYKTALNEAINSGELIAYIKEYNNSENMYLKKACSIRDSIAFANLKRTYTDYSNYINLYPNSKYLDTIKYMLPSVLYGQAYQESSIELFEIFIENYPANEFTPRAKARLEVLYFGEFKKKPTLSKLNKFKQKFPQSNLMVDFEEVFKNRDNFLYDTRDGNIYQIVKIGKYVWMAENLNYAANGSLCYDNLEENCMKYGRLYHISEARNACPENWHLPHTEYYDLRLEGMKLEGIYDLSKAWESQRQTIGKYLKSTTGWQIDYKYDKNANGNNALKFNAIPAGFVDDRGNFSHIGIHAEWWSTNKGGAVSAIRTWSLGSWSATDIGQDEYDFRKDHREAYSIRCVRDY